MIWYVAPKRLLVALTYNRYGKSGPTAHFSDHAEYLSSQSLKASSAKPHQLYVLAIENTPHSAPHVFKLPSLRTWMQTLT